MLSFIGSVRGCIGTQGEGLSAVGSVLSPPPPVVCAAGRSRAVVPVLFLFCVALWFALVGLFVFWVFSCSLSSCFIIPFGIVVVSFGEVGGGEAGVCASCACVCFVRVGFCQFSLPLSSGLAAVCDCGTPWTFLLTFFILTSNACYLLFDMCTCITLLTL